MHGSLSAELNAMAQELARFGRRCADASRDWLNDRRHDMNRYPQGQQERAGSRQHEQGRWQRGEREAEDMEQRTYGRQGSYREYGSDRYNQERGYDEPYYYGSPRGYRGEAPYASGVEADDDEHRYQGGRYQGDYPHSGYERGYGGPGGYGPEGRYASGQREFGRGYGGSDYRRESYAGMGGSLRREDVPWREGAGASPYRGESSSMRFGGEGLGLTSSYQRHDVSQDPNLRGFRGRGPKNYTRSDERIREDLNERLSDADDIDASGITVDVKQGVVTLEGDVAHRWMKYRAEDLAESCGGVRDIENRLRVRESETAGIGERSRFSPTGEEQARGQYGGYTQTTATGSTTTGTPDKGTEGPRH